MPGLFDAKGGPEFSIMGRILGGQGYASNWFSQRDAMLREQMEKDRARAERGGFAKQMVASPEFETFMKDPNDRRAAYSLWALSQGGPEAIANSQASYLSQTLQDIGNQEQAKLTAGLQKDNLTYNDQLQRGQIKMTADEQLRVDEVKRQRDGAAAARAAQVFEELSGQGAAANELATNAAFDQIVKDTGFTRPADKSVVFGPNQQVLLIPSTGSDEHIEMMGKMNARMGMIDNMSLALRGMEDGTLSAGDWDAIWLDTVNYSRAAEKTGALDQGTTDTFALAFPRYSYTGLSPTTEKTKDALSTYVELQRAKIPAIAAEYSVPLERIPRALDYKTKLPPFDPDKPHPLQQKGTRRPALSPDERSSPAPYNPDRGWLGSPGGGYGGTVGGVLMPDIIKTERGKDGGLWGLDRDSNEWIPIDEAQQKGSFLGNLGRAAGRGFESVGQGVTELMAPIMDPAAVPGVEAAGEEFRQREAIAGQTAPWAEMLGGGAPELAAGTGIALGTGGASVPLQLGAQALTGGILGGLRTAESNSDRAANAAFGAAASMVGEIAGPVAVRGISAGALLAESVINRGFGRLARETDAAQILQQARTAAPQAAGEAVPQPGSVGAATTPQPGSVGAATTPQPGSVGAATTPRGQLGEIGAESAAMDVDEATGAAIKNPGLGKERDAAMQHGYQDPWYAGTRAGSESRVRGAVRELNPAQDILNQRVANENSALKAKLTGRALGLGDNEARDIISDADLLQAEATIADGFERVAKELPNIGNSEYVTALNKVDVPKGAVGATKAESFLADMKANLSKNESAFVTPEAFMRDVQVLTGEMADAYKMGRVTDGDMLGQAVNYLYDLGERATKNQPSRYGLHGRDETIVSKEWAEVRKQHQIYRMITQPGVRSPTGEINSQALYRKMTANKKSGGWGIEGPPAGSPMRGLFEVVRYDRGASTQVPMTGVRAAMQLAKTPLGGGAIGAGAAMGAGEALGLWD